MVPPQTYQRTKRVRAVFQGIKDIVASFESSLSGTETNLVVKEQELADQFAPFEKVNEERLKTRALWKETSLTLSESLGTKKENANTQDIGAWQEGNDWDKYDEEAESFTGRKWSMLQEVRGADHDATGVKVREFINDIQSKLHWLGKHFQYFLPQYDPFEFTVVPTKVWADTEQQILSRIPRGRAFLKLGEENSRLAREKSELEQKLSVLQAANDQQVATITSLQKAALNEQHLQQTAIDIRLRFHENIKKNRPNSSMTRSGSGWSTKLVDVGNKAAHEGNYRADQALFSNGTWTEQDNSHFLYVYKNDLGPNAADLNLVIGERCDKLVEIHNLRGTMIAIHFENGNAQTENDYQTALTRFEEVFDECVEQYRGIRKECLENGKGDPLEAANKKFEDSTAVGVNVKKLKTICSDMCATAARNAQQ